MISSWESTSVFKQLNLLEDLWLRLSKLIESTCWKKRQPLQLFPFFSLQMWTLPTNPCVKSGRSRRETVELFISLQTKVKRFFSEYFSWKPRMKSHITWPICLFWGNLRFNYFELYLCSWCAHMIFLKPKYSNETIGKSC